MFYFEWIVEFCADFVLYWNSNDIHVGMVFAEKSFNI